MNIVRQGINILPTRYLFFVSHVVDFLHDMLLIACALWNQLPVLRFSLASTEMMYPPLLFTLFQFVPFEYFPDRSFPACRSSDNFRIFLISSRSVM